MARRFARVFEFDRDEDREGTPEQQKAVRDQIEFYAKNYPRLDRILLALDRARNRKGRHFVTVSFVDLDGFVIGFGTPSSILLEKDLPPASLIGWLVLHELGHVVGWNVLTPKDGSEEWAWEFQRWCSAGTPEGATWGRLMSAITAADL